jgi:hypothetical protein
MSFTFFDTAFWKSTNWMLRKYNVQAGARGVAARAGRTAV